MSDYIWDYERIAPSCQYSVYLDDTNECVDCGEPSVYRVWWEWSDGYIETYVFCEKHFRFVQKSEEEIV